MEKAKLWIGERVNLLYIFLEIVSIPLLVGLHELGHYVAARLFGCNACLGLRDADFCTVYVADDNFEVWKRLVISFCGVFGCLAFVPSLVVGDYYFVMVMFPVFFGYSLVEVVLRYKNVRGLIKREG